MPNPYKKFARLYDEITDPSDDFLQFVKKFLKKKKLKILDLGCGTGKYAVPLTKSGFVVTALDPSADMLKEAKKKAKGVKKINFVKGDIRKAKEKEFDVVMSSECINHMRDEIQLLETFSGVKKALTNKGKFIFDLSTKTYFENSMKEREYGGRIGKDYFIWDDYLFGDDYHIELSLFVKKSKSDYMKFEEYYHQKVYSVTQIKKNLRKAGFGKIRIYGENFGKPKHSDEKTYFVAD